MNTISETYHCPARDEDGRQCTLNSDHYGKHQHDCATFGENNGEQHWDEAHLDRGSVRRRLRFRGPRRRRADVSRCPLRLIRKGV